MNVSALSMLSDFHKSYKEICKLTAEKKEKTRKVEEKIAKYKSENKPELEDGSINPNYSLSKFEVELGKIKAEYDAAVKPLREAMSPAQKLVDKDMYYAYAVSMTKGSLSSTGSIKVPSKKGDVTYTVKQSYQAQVLEFLRSLGLLVDNKTAMEKCAKSLAFRCGGMLKDNNGNYLKLRNVSGFNQIMILAFLQYAIVDRKALIVNEDNTLSRNIPTEEAVA